MEDDLEAVFGRPVSGRRIKQLAGDAALAAPEPDDAPEPEASQPSMATTAAKAPAAGAGAGASPSSGRADSGSRDDRPPGSTLRADSSFRNVRFRFSGERGAEDEDPDMPPAPLHRLSLSGLGRSSDAPRSSAVLAESPKALDGPLALDACCDPEGDIEHEGTPPAHLALDNNSAALLSQGSSSHVSGKKVGFTTSAEPLALVSLPVTCLSSHYLCRRLGTASTIPIAKSLVIQMTSSAAQWDRRRPLLLSSSWAGHHPRSSCMGAQTGSSFLLACLRSLVGPSPAFLPRERQQATRTARARSLPMMSGGERCSAG